MIVDDLEQSLRTIVEKRLRDQAQRKYVESTIMDAFATMRKKPVADLAERITVLQVQVQKMVEDLSVEFVRGALVVRATGSAEALLNQFRRGSSWFDPEPKIDNIIVAATLADPKRK